MASLPKQLLPELGMGPVTQHLRIRNAPSSGPCSWGTQEPIAEEQLFPGDWWEAEVPSMREHRCCSCLQPLSQGWQFVQRPAPVRSPAGPFLQRPAQLERRSPVGGGRCRGGWRQIAQSSSDEKERSQAKVHLLGGSSLGWALRAGHSRERVLDLGKVSENSKGRWVWSASTALPSSPCMP